MISVGGRGQASCRFRRCRRLAVVAVCVTLTGREGGSELGRELSAADESIRSVDRCPHARSAAVGRPPGAAARSERCRARRSRLD